MPSKITDPQKWQRKSSGVISIDSCIDHWSRADPELNLSPQCQCPSRAMREKRLTTSLLKCFCLTTSLWKHRQLIKVSLVLLPSIRLPDNHSSTQKQNLITIELSRCFEREEKNIFRPAQVYGLFRAMYILCTSLSLTAPPRSPPRVNLGSLGLAACAVAVPCCDEDLAQAHPGPRQLSNTQTDAQFSCLTNPKQYGMRLSNVNSK